MSWIIKIDNLSKIYRIGAGATEHGTLYEQVNRKIKNLFKKEQETADESQKISTEHAVVSQKQTEDLPPGYFWALRDINLEIMPGERIGLVGQNGSGKSTLLKILSRITAPTHGEFRYRGHLISLLEVGTGFHPELSGKDNIYLNAAINGLTHQEIKERFNDILAFSELGEQINTPVKRYSSGMYMRLAFSVAAFLESEILLIDEVLAVGDSDFQKKCKEKMLEVANDGRTVIFVSHDMKAIESICNKKIEMSHGQIVNISPINAQNSTESTEKENQDELEKVASTNLSANEVFSLSSMKEWDDESPVEQSFIRPASISLLNDDGQLQDKFSVNENINIRVNYYVKQEASSLLLRISLLDANDNKLFSSINNLNLQKLVRKKGFYSETLVIPHSFLNEGFFRFNIEFVDPDSRNIYFKDSSSVSMKIIDDFLPIGVRGDWQGAWPEGYLLRPKLDWSTSCFSDSETNSEAVSNHTSSNIE